MLPTLDSRIDDLYKQPPGAFVAARNALAKTLAGDDRARVTKLAKPTAVPWAVNQVYWHARASFDHLRAAGDALREAQVAALAGPSRADLPALGAAHRQALTRAVQDASRLAREAGVPVDADAVMRTLETLSLAKHPPAPPGRLTEPLQPAGFEALAGVAPRESGPAAAPVNPDRPDEREGLRIAAPAADRKRAAEEAAAKKAEADARAREAQRRAEEALHAAQADLARAKAAEAEAKDAWDRATRAREEAERVKSAAAEVASRQSSVVGFSGRTSKPIR